MEASYRITFTDYLDDVSARGNSPKKDGYAFVSVKAQFCPSAPKKKKKQNLPPPTQYDGPKGTKTWKNTPREQPKPKNNYYEEPDTTGGDNGGTLEEGGDGNTEENPSGEEQPTEQENTEQQPAEEKQEDNGWGK